jgi:outer membrane protein assembly factor BamD (BamD/ComL family)
LIYAAFCLLVAAPVARSQDGGDLSELRFVRELRARHYTDLALEYLQRLQNGKPSPELLRELPLELAKTRLEAAADEPTSSKRLTLFESARAEIESFLKQNPDHPRAGEARLDIARVVILQGKTQLSQALAQDSLDARIADADRARQKFVDAAGLLKASADEMDAALAKLDDPKSDADKARRAKLEHDRLQARLAVALNLIDQSATYVNEAKDQVLIDRGKKVQEANKLLEGIAGQDATNPVCWQAAAWLGQCLYLNGDPPKARAKLTEVINSVLPAATDGRRLARYFKLEIQCAQPSEEEKRDTRFPATLISEANSWLVSYPSFAQTPEGCGIRLLFAELLQRRAGEKQTTPPQKEADLAKARRLLKEVEQTENDFTDRARRLKIQIIKARGGFNRQPKDLPTFEDCYVRAQYEIISASQEGKSDKDGAAADPKKVEDIRNTRADTVIAVLRRGLSLPDAKPDGGKVTPEVNNAKAMLAFYCLKRERLREAIEFGEGFARDDPRSAQAAMAAVYALQAYSRLIAQRERDNTLPEEVKPDRDKMLALARYIEERWPKELAGDVARHQIGAALLREQRLAKDPVEQTRQLTEAGTRLLALGKDYPSYSVARYQLADAYLQAEKDNLEPPAGQKVGYFRQQALVILKTLPKPGAGGDAAAGQAFLMGKVKLAWELYKDKDIESMLRLGDELARQLTDLPMDDAVRQQMAVNVADVRLFATGSLAESEFGKAHYEQVAAKLDPLTAAINAADTGPENKLLAGELRKNLQLGTALLSMDLRANVQLGKLDQVEPILKAMQALTADGGEDAGGSAKILQTLVFVIRQQIDELDKKSDKENKDKAVAGFSKILDRFADKPDKLDMQSRLLLARCYSNMERHDRAAELLEKVASANEKGAQLLYARELRLNLELEKARRVLSDILGTANAPGWGARSVDALLEDVALMEEEHQYDKAAVKANDIVRRLLPQVTRDNAMKDKFLEAYFHVVYSFVKHGQSLNDPARRDKELRRAAAQAAELDRKWPNYGGDASAKRFNDFFRKEPGFKQLVDQLKASEK